MNYEIIECAQGSAEWHQARAGLTTASTFADCVATMKKASGGRKVGDRTGKADQIAAETAIESIIEKAYGDTGQTFAMRRGSEQEWQAREAYQKKTGYEVTESGIAVTIPERLYGYSTDGHVEGERGGIEIKTPLNGSVLAEMLESGNIADYEHQIQGGMWICGWEWVDYVMWMPELHERTGNGLYVKRIHRNDDFIDAMVERLVIHVERVKYYRALFMTDMDLLAQMGAAAVRMDDAIDVSSRIIMPAKEISMATPEQTAAVTKTAALPPPIDGLEDLFR